MLQGEIRSLQKINKSLNNSPLITVITVVWNSNELIEQTILSIVNQSYSNIEYIIIDGGSTDGTLDIIKKYECCIDFWKSEPDKGIYDAMNKGIALATGEWINFLNAGDVFFDNSTTNDVVFEIIKRHVDIIYGDFIAFNDSLGASLLVKAKSLKTIFRGNIFSHQSCFIRSVVLRDNLFDIKYKIAADYNQMLSLFLKRKVFFYMSIPFAVMNTDGISYSNMKTYIEQMKIVHFYKPYSYNLLFYIPSLFVSLIRIFLGQRVTSFVRRFKWRNLYFVL